MTPMHAPQEVASWLHASGARHLHCDSRRLQAGDALVAWPGAAQDGRRYVSGALAQGAVAAVVERDGLEAFGLNDPRVASVEGLKAQTGAIAAHFYRHPSHELPVVAITGTNGKTSTAWWTAQWLTALGQAAAVVGTLGMGVPGQTLKPTGLTTPDPVMLQSGLRYFVETGLRACVLEASSIGLEEGRLNATQIDTAVFTNFTQDHLDYHGSMDAYWAAKEALFQWPALRVAVVNVDDPKGLALAQALRPRAESGALDLWTLSVTGQDARLRVSDWSMTDTGLRFHVVEQEQGADLPDAPRIKVPLVGEYNLYNLLCALAVVRAQGHSLADAVATSAALTPVPGRMQSVAPVDLPGQPLVLVDYCHTPDALSKALQALQPMAWQRGGALWCVVGCGGDRDPGKRPLMAAAAEREATHLVLTSDNPRSEDPQRIVSSMVAGLSQPAAAVVELDRAKAIAWAVAQAQPNDVVLLAGKGHEDYQEVAGVKTPFSDVEQGWRALQARAAGAQEAAR